MSGTNIAWVNFPDGYLGVERWGAEVWNPVVGCTPAPGSEQGGCRNCYARVLHDKRHGDNRRAADEAIVGSVVGQVVIKQARKHGVKLPWPPQYGVPFATVQLLPERLEQPLHWRKPRAVFVDSMSDLFHPDVPDEFIDRVFATMALTPQHRYIILTKRPERMREYVSGLSSRVPEIIADFYIEKPARAGLQPFTSDLARAITWPLPNVWLLVSVEDQATANERIPLLLDTPAAVHGVSLEPMLGPVDIEPWLGCAFGRPYHADEPSHDCAFPGLDWVIVGGESGKGHRDLDMAWVESVYDQCQAAGIPFFGKQRAGASSGLPLLTPYDLREWPVIS